MKNKYTKLIMLLIIVVILSLIFTGNAFAQNTTMASWWAGSSTAMLTFLHWLAKMFLLIWYIPAIIAWKLMTNDFAYGHMINLDIYLWKMWNIMKNFANFFLWFYLIVIILKSFFKWEPGSVLKKDIPKLMIAGILIQLSRFVMWAIIDISTIMVMAVGAFPMEYFDTPAHQAQLKKSYCATPKTITVLKLSPDPKEMDANFSKELVPCDKSAIDNLLANANDMSGPLLYFGFSVLKFHEYDFLSSDTYSEWKMIYQQLMKSLIIIMFVIPLILLAIVNIVRLVYIWLWIIFSPFLVINNVFGGLFGKKEWWGSEMLKFSNVIGLIFQPVAIIWCLWLWLILVTSMSNMFTGNTAKPEEDLAKFSLVCESDYKSCTIQPLGEWMKGYGDFTVEGTMLKDSSTNSLQWWLGYIIVTFMTLFLLWALIKVWFSTSKLTKWITDWVFKFMKDTAQLTPVLPWWVSLWSVKKAWKDLQQFVTRPIIRADEQKVKEKLEWMFGLTGTDISSTFKQKLLKKANASGDGFRSAETFFQWLRKEMSDKQIKASFATSKDFRESVKEWVESPLGQTYLANIKWVINATDEDIKDFDKLIQNDKFKAFIDKHLSWSFTDYNSTEQIKEQAKDPMTDNIHTKTYG